MTKILNFGAEATKTKIGSNTKVRLQVRDGNLMVLFTNRSNVSNLKTDLLKDLRVKGSGRRVSVPDEFSSMFENNFPIVLHPAKHHWFRVEQIMSLQPGSGEGRVSAQ